MPLLFQYTETDIPAIWSPSNKLSKLMIMLKSEWDKLHERRDVFRYKIHSLQERMVDNKYLLQLNLDRGSKRRQPDEINNICQQFDPDKFNFTKIDRTEIMFEISKEGLESHTILVNVSPISWYHSLLCPTLDKCLPQVITEDSLQLILEISFLAQNRKMFPIQYLTYFPSMWHRLETACINITSKTGKHPGKVLLPIVPSRRESDLRIGYNSLCALASVNHLHYHLFVVSDNLPIDSLPCKQVKERLYAFEAKYPVKAFVFQLKTKGEISQVSQAIFVLIKFLLESNIAHNLFVGRGVDVTGENQEVLRIVVWPRKSSCGVKQFEAFNVAVCEMSGWFPIFSLNEFNSLTSETIENELSKWNHEGFSDLCAEVAKLY